MNSFINQPVRSLPCPSVPAKSKKFFRSRYTSGIRWIGRGRRPVAFFPQPALEEPSAVTEVGDMAVDKRKALQPVLDSIEKGWQIVKPSRLTPDNLETECIF